MVNSSRRIVELSILMSNMLVHGYNAADLFSSTMISIPIDARGDMSRSDNSADLYQQMYLNIHLRM